MKLERLTNRGLSAVMAVSAASQVSALDQLLDTVLEELLEAIDGAALGWVYLAQDLPDDLVWPAVTLSPSHTVYLAAYRQADRAGPGAAGLRSEERRVGKECRL